MNRIFCLLFFVSSFFSISFSVCFSIVNSFHNYSRFIHTILVQYRIYFFYIYIYTYCFFSHLLDASFQFFHYIIYFYLFEFSLLFYKHILKCSKWIELHIVGFAILMITWYGTLLWNDELLLSSGSILRQNTHTHWHHARLWTGHHRLTHRHSLLHSYRKWKRKITTTTKNNQI